MVNSIFTNRRAVRNFSSESISDDEIKSLIAAFQTTPCGMHQTDVMSLVVVKDEALRDKIETKTDNACYHAPVLFIINTKKDSMFGERDASCGAENIMLEATDLGLGSVYVMGGAARLNDDSELQKELGIDPAFSDECHRAGWQDWRKTGSNGSFKLLSSYNLLIKKCLGKN